MKFKSVETHVYNTLYKLAKENDRVLEELVKECTFKVGGFEVRPVISTYGKDVTGYEAYFKGVWLNKDRTKTINTQEEAEKLIASEYSDNTKINDSFKDALEKYHEDLRDLEQDTERLKDEIFGNLSSRLKISNFQEGMITPKFNRETFAIEGYTFRKEPGEETFVEYTKPIETVGDFKEFVEFATKKLINMDEVSNDH